MAAPSRSRAFTPCASLRGFVPISAVLCLVLCLGLRLAAPALAWDLTLATSAALDDASRAPVPKDSGAFAPLAADELPERFLPKRFLVVDKSSQQIYLLEQKSPLSIKASYACTTGQAVGDKLREGDKKTPEGVYFIQSRLDSGLDFDLYGNLAHTLDFPNPVDRLRGKTGSGIWIHGRGHEIVPRETLGCVALNLPDIKELDRELAPGTPVLISEDLSWVRAAETEFEATAGELVRDVERWALAWRLKSETFFSYYDTSAFSQVQEASFASFRDHKERLFASLDWIQVTVHDVEVLPGPDYWVTSFHQFYRSPELASSGVKRLYWRRGANGEFSIIGRDWVRGGRDLKADYIAQMRKELATFIESWRANWQAGDLSGYLSFYDDRAVQDARAGLAAIKAHKEDLWQRMPPARVDVTDLDVAMHEEGLQVTFTQRYESTDAYSDLGVKKLVVRPDGGAWRIVQETWSAL